jgi:anti-anti-sigma factor
MQGSPKSGAGQTTRPETAYAERVDGDCAGVRLETDTCSISQPGELMTSYELEQRPAEDARVVLVQLMGELDLTNAHEVEERLEELAAPNGARLVLDVNRVVFIDSAALHVLFRTARRLGKGRFALVLEPTAPVARTLAIVGISEVATIAESASKLASTASLE